MAFGHDGGVHDHLLRAGFLDDVATQGGINTGRQQRLHAFFSNVLSPARQAARVDEQLGLQVGLAAEEPLVQVLHSGVDHCFVGRIEGVLQVQQPSHQARRQGRVVTAGGKRDRKGALDLGPVDQRGQSDQRVLHVELLVQLGRDSWPDCGCEGSGPIGILGVICKKTGTGKTIPCKACAHQSAERRVKSRACELFKADWVCGGPWHATSPPCL